MQKHVSLYIGILSILFFIGGFLFILSTISAYSEGIRTSALFSLFIAFIHFFIVFGLVTRKKWVPYVGIFFQIYLAFNFLISNSSALSSKVMIPSVIVVFGVSAVVAVSLFSLRNQFNK